MKQVKIAIYLAATLFGAFASADTEVTKAEGLKTLLNNPKAVLIYCQDQEVTSKATLRNKGDLKKYYILNK